MAITVLVNNNENYLAPYNHFKEIQTPGNYPEESMTFRTW
jgi:hypothetical protein